MANQPSKYSKFLVGAASAALVASAVAPVASAADFSDVKGNTHEDAINALVKAGVISGYPDGTFLPNKTLSRSDVVKMMGKLLVSLGKEVPTDYKTVQRFDDLPLNANEELVKYAALTFDAGVFKGNNGKLDAAGNITRENMAIVLVRAYDAINKTDLVAHVKEQEFKKDVTDLATAKEEARAAIDVLDFYDITNPVAPKFNPKATTTRGQFASFLFKTTAVEVPAEKVTTATKVESVTATNLKEVEVKFDGTVDEDTATDKANYSLKSGKAIKSAAISEDKKSVTLTVVGTLANNKVDAVSLSNVKAGDKTISDKNVAFTAVDNVLPEVKEIKSLGTKSVKVTFSEPVKGLKQTNFTLDGKAYFGNIVMGANDKSVILTPYSTTALAVGEHKITVSGVTDYADFISLTSTHDFTVVEDKDAPTITEATATLESVTLTFSEDVDPSTVSSSKVYWKSGDSKITATGEVEVLADNKFKFHFSTANTLPTGKVDIFVEGVKDYSANEIAKDTKVTVTPEIDQVRPEVRKISINNAAGTEVKVTFSKAINGDSAKVLTNYAVTDSKGKVVSVQDAKVDPTDSKSVIITLYRAVTVGENTVVVKNVKDATKLQNTMLDYTGKIVKADGVAPEVESAVNKAGRQVVLKFDKKMDIDTLTNHSNYLVRIDGTLQTLTPALADISILQDSTVVAITFAESISDKEVVLASGNGASGKTNINELVVLGLKDVAGNLLKQFTDNGIGSVTNVIQLNADTRVALKEFDDVDHAGKYAELIDTKTVKVKFDTGVNSTESGAFVAKVNGSVVAIDSVVVDGSSSVTLKFKEALKTDAAGLTIDVDYTKLVNIAGNKGVNPVVSGVVTLDQITLSGTFGLLDSVAAKPVFATGETEYHVTGNKIVITYSEALLEVGDATLQNLRDTDFTVTRISNNTKLKPETEFDAVVEGNTIVITLGDSRSADTAYTVSVKDAKYFTDLSGNEIADSTGKSKLVTSSGVQTLAAAKAAAATAKTNATTAKTAHTTAGALATDAEYVAVTAATTALDTAVATDVTADIVTATTALETKITALETATAAHVAAKAALVTAKANAATAKAAAREAQVAHILAGGSQADTEYVTVTTATTALDTAVASDVTANIVAKTSDLNAAKVALEALTAGI